MLDAGALAERCQIVCYVSVHFQICLGVILIELEVSGDAAAICVLPAEVVDGFGGMLSEVLLLRFKAHFVNFGRV